MPRRARISLIGAGIGGLLLALTWYVSHYIGFARRADLSILTGFAQLDRPGVDRLTSFVAGLCDPHTYVFLAAAVVVVALLRRRPLVAVMIAIVLLGANETTQLLKPLLAAPRDYASWIRVAPASWPSGHATAAMALALCSVIAAPARRRPMVATVMAGFAIAVCYSFLELGWHYPSDVLGGFLVASTWTLLGIAGLSIYAARREGVAEERRRSRGATVSIVEALAPVATMLAVAAAGFGLIVLARPEPVITFAHQHTAFVVGAGAIAALGVTLASGLTLMLRRG